MPILPVAAPRLLKPDRTIVAPDHPGWDDALPDRPRVGRSRWWRRLLSGRAGLTRLQPGACCGCVSTCACAACSVPKTDLTLTLVGTGCHNGTYTMTPDPLCGGQPQPCVWQVSYTCSGQQFFFRLVCVAFEWTIQYYTADPCASATLFCNKGTSAATSYTCSPLFIQWPASACPLVNATITVSA